jgi:hypothetical protein
MICIAGMTESIRAKFHNRFLRQANSCMEWTKGLGYTAALIGIN